MEKKRSHKLDEEKSATTRPRSLTYRLQGIPHHAGPQAVKSFVKKGLQLGQDANVKVCSLANSPYRQDEKVATLTISEKWDRLPCDAKKDEWSFDIPDDIAKGDVSLKLDTHFRGFTPLHQNDTEIKIESVLYPQRRYVTE